MLVLVAFGLLVIVTGGSVYLTMTDWRDRRRRDEEARSQKAPRKK
jgi:Tfp pilus assembly protein PilW